MNFFYVKMEMYWFYLCYNQSDVQVRDILQAPIDLDQVLDQILDRQKQKHNMVYFFLKHSERRNELSKLEELIL